MCLFIPSVSFEGNEPVSCQDTIMWKIFLIFNVLFTDTDLGTSWVSSRTSQHRILSWNIPLKILFQASINSFWRRPILNSSLNKSHFTLLQSAKASFQMQNDLPFSVFNRFVPYCKLFCWNHLGDHENILSPYLFNWDFKICLWLLHYLCASQSRL